MAARISQGAAILLVGLLGWTTASAQEKSSSAQTPIVFVHGNGDDAARWIPTIWLFESNGYARDRLFAVRFSNPAARTRDTQEEPFRSSTTEARTQLSLFVEDVLKQTHAQKVILIGSSRGGLTIRNYLRNGGGAAKVSAAILCGTPNHGVIDSDVNPDGEFNGRGAFLRGLNEAGSDGVETVAGVRMMTLRSDNLDKFAQPTGITGGHPESLTGVSFAGPELRGATNLVLPGSDHRELAFSRAAFAAMYRFLVGSPPKTVEVQDETAPRLSGLITRYAGVVPTNEPLGNVRLRVYKVPASAQEKMVAPPVYETVTSPAGSWGPFPAEPHQEYEFELQQGHEAGSPEPQPIRYFIAGLPRSTGLLNLRVMPLPATIDTLKQIPTLVIMRPEGYFSRERDHVLVDGTQPSSEPSGLPIRDSFTIDLPQHPTVVTLRSEKINIPTLDPTKPGLNIAYLLW